MTDTAEAGAGVEAAGGDVAEPGAPLPVAEDEVRVIVGAGLLAESCPVIVRTEEVEPGFGEVEQAFSSLTRFSPLAPVIGVRTMVQTSVNTEEPTVV